jgi:hypothetical protein
MLILWIGDRRAVALRGLAALHYPGVRPATA